MKNRFLVIFAIAMATAVSPVSGVAQQKTPPQQRDKPLQTQVLTPIATNISKPASTSKSNNSKTVEKHVSSAVELAVLDEINAVRKDPRKYIQYLEEYKKLYKGKTIYLPTFVRIETNEGIAAVDEAIEFLKTAPPLEPLSFSNGLNKASATQLSDLIENSSLGHTSKDGSNLTVRLAKFGKAGFKTAENIAFFAEIPRNIVLQMIIDDGVKARSHRKNLFNSSFKFSGIAFGKGKTGEGLTVVVFADSFNETIGGSTGVIEM